MTLTPTRIRLLVFSLLAVTFLGALDHTIVATSLATIAGELGALEQISWVIVAYTLTSTVLLPVIGKLADRVGVRAIYLVSLVIFIVASALCGFAQNIEQLAAARIVQGIGGAGLQLLPQVIIGHAVSPRERPKLLSIIGAAFPIAILVGPLIGGAITDVWGWRWIFWVKIPLGVAAFIFSLMAIPAIDTRRGGRFDVLGAVLLGLSVIALVAAANAFAVGDPAPVTVGALALALLGLALFVWRQKGAHEPIMPLHTFRNRTVVMCVILSLVIGVGLFSVTSYVPTYIQMAYGVSATVSGLVPIATVFGMLLSTLVSGWLIARNGHFRPYAIVGCALAAAGLGLMAVLPAGLPLGVPMVVMAFVGIGTGAFMNVLIAVAQSAVRASELGSVTSTVNLVRQVGSTTATALVGGIIGAGVVAGLPAGIRLNDLTPSALAELAPAARVEIADLYVAVLSPIFWGLAAVYAIGVVAALAMPNVTLSSRSPQTSEIATVPNG